MRLMWSACFLLLIVSSMGIEASSNQGQATIKGVLLDQNDARIPRTRMIFRTGTVERRTYSDDEGSFEIDLNVGEYEVEIESIGFKKLELTHLEVIAGLVKEMRIHLEALADPICILTVSTGDDHIEKVPPPLLQKMRPRKLQ